MALLQTIPSFIKKKNHEKCLFHILLLILFSFEVDIFLKVGPHSCFYGDVTFSPDKRTGRSRGTINYRYFMSRACVMKFVLISRCFKYFFYVLIIYLFILFCIFCNARIEQCKMSRCMEGIEFVYIKAWSGIKSFLVPRDGDVLHLGDFCWW